MGLLSPSGVHSYEEQIVAMAELAAKRGLDKIYLHAFWDGRDLPPQSAMVSLELLEAKFAALGVGRIASIVGRFYAMDRDNLWDRVKQIYDLIAKGEAACSANSSLQGLEAAYACGETDEFVLPTAILDVEHHAAALDAEDSAVFMNFRADRVREISLALTSSTFDSFDRGRAPHAGYYCTLTEYQRGVNYDAAFPGKDGILAPSPKIRTYDLQPEMNTAELTDNLVDAITGGKYDIVICNYANCDMVGHTGIIDAAILAVEAVDTSRQRIVDALNSVGGQMLITADHGNIVQMLDKKSGQPYLAHTTNPVPLVYADGDRPLGAGGSLSDLAHTVLAILGLPQAVEMTGRSLIKFA